MKSIQQIKYEIRAKRLVRAFQQAYQNQNKHSPNSRTSISALESAFDFYSSLNPRDKSNLRAYTSKNSEITFTKAIQTTSNLKPGSTAEKVGLLRLTKKIQTEIQKLSKSESQKYLLILNNTK